MARAAIEAAIQEQWIRVAAPQESGLKLMLLRQVHRGEAEAIALVTDLKAEILFIDEMEGRSLAEQAGLSVSGTLGVLLRAKRSGQIGTVKAEIESPRSKTRFFLSASLEAKVLKAAGE